MADYGFRALNGNNEVQIDSTYKNFSLRAKGTSIANLPSVHGSFKFAEAVLPSSAGMVAFRCAGPCVIGSMRQSGANIIVSFLVYAPFGEVHTVFWYLFDEPNYGIQYAEPYAMRIKGPTGLITHDSRQEYLKFSGFVTGVATDIPTTNSNTSPNYRFFTYPGTLPAVLQGMTTSSQTEVPIGVGPGVQYMQFFFFQMFAQIGESIGSSICVQDFGPSTTPGNVPDIRRDNYACTIIDVARYA